MSGRGRRLTLEVLLVVGVFALVAAGCGWVWQQVWEPPEGVVVEGRWFPSEVALRSVFDGTGWYCVLAAGAGLVLGVLAGWSGRTAPLLTLVAVVVGSVLAAWVMYVVGTHGNPPDPVVLAAGSPDGTRLPVPLTLEGGRSPYLVWPLAALVGLMVVNFLGASTDDLRTRDRHDPRWLTRNPAG